MLRSAPGAGFRKGEKRGKDHLPVLKKGERAKCHVMGSVDRACSFPPLKHEKALSLNSVSEYDE